MDMNKNEMPDSPQARRTALQKEKDTIEARLLGPNDLTPDERARLVQLEEELTALDNDPSQEKKAA